VAPRPADVESLAISGEPVASAIARRNVAITMGSRTSRSSFVAKLEASTQASAALWGRQVLRLVAFCRRGFMIRRRAPRPCC